MKNTLIILVVIMSLYSCANEKTFYFKNGKEITQQEFDHQAFTLNNKDTFSLLNAKPYGWVNYDINKCDNIAYEVVIGNVVWGIILCETIAMPVYFSGWALYEPVKLKKINNGK